MERPLTAPQLIRLSALIDAEPKVTLAAVVVGPVPDALWSLRGDGSSAERKVVLEPASLSLSPQWLEASRADCNGGSRRDHRYRRHHRRTVVERFRGQPDPPPDNVTYLDCRSTTWGTAGTTESGP